jgi:hypothetical protein
MTVAEFLTELTKFSDEINQISEGEFFGQD